MPLWTARALNAVGGYGNPCQCARATTRAHRAAKATTRLASELQKLIEADGLVLMVVVSLIVSVETTNTPVGGTHGRSTECFTMPRRFKFNRGLGNGSVIDHPLWELPTQLHTERAGAPQARFLRK